MRRELKGCTQEELAKGSVVNSGEFGASLGTNSI